MNLAVDVGNTHTVIGQIDKGEVVSRFRLETRNGMTADELINQWNSLFNDSITENINLWVASVVPELSREIRELNSRGTISARFLKHPWTEATVQVETDNPSRVGADRVAGASAFYEEFGEGIVVDFGTATTLDLITKPGKYEGGIIFPGIEASASGLSSKAAMLPQISPEAPDQFSLSETLSGLKSGLYFGTAGAVERLIKEIRGRSSLSPDAVVTATGGGAREMATITDIFTHIRENLVLHGLRLAFGNQ